MPRPPRIDDANPGHGDRCISSCVAILFFAPVLALLWFGTNLALAWPGAGGRVPLPVLVGAIAASAVLGFVAPRATPVVFGWLASGFHRCARLWW